jgi:glycosyltransferase involved in cell wall biosynthesis
MIPLSVVISTHNRCQGAVSVIEAALPQLLPDDELIVSDDASTDGTAERLSSYPRVQLHHQPVNLGMVGNWNFCLSAGSRDWVLIIHDDDHLMPGALTAIRRVCALAKGPALVGHSEWVPRRQFPDGALAYEYREPGPGAALDAELCPSGMTLHRSIVKDLGPFNPLYKYSADMEYFARICAKYPSFIIERPRIIEYVLHDDNIQIRTWRKPDFLTELERVERASIAHANLDPAAATEEFNRRLRRDVSHMVITSRRNRQWRQVRRFAKVLLGAEYGQRISPRGRVGLTIGATFGWYPRRLFF